MNSKQSQKATMFRVAALAMALMATLAFISGCSRGFADTVRVVSADEGKLTVAEENGLNQETHEVAPDAEVILDGQPAVIDDLEKGDAVKLTTESLDDGTEVVKKIEAKSHEELEADKPAIGPLEDQPAAPIGPLTDEPMRDMPKRPSELNGQDLQKPLPEADRPISPEDDSPQAAPDADEDPHEDAAMADESFSGKISSLGDGDFVIKDDSDGEHTFTVNGDTKYTLDGKDATFDDLKVTYSVNVTAEKDGDNYVAKSVDATSDASSE